MAIHIKELHVRIHGSSAGKPAQEDPAGPKSAKGGKEPEDTLPDQELRKMIAEEVQNQLAKLKRR